MSGPLAVVAMSGGVDSSVAAALLLERGYRVEAASLRLWDSPSPDRSRVCSDWRDAAAVAGALGIPHTVIDQREPFERAVVQPLVEQYTSGRTPNPCVACNSDFKLGVLLDWALERGASFVATGHYARVERGSGEPRLLTGVDASADQSYFLFGLSPHQLQHTLFPVGDLGKGQVRDLARRAGIPVAEKPSSQDLCFGNVASFVRSRAAGGRAGTILAEDGAVLGRHDGIEGYTIGQRRGLGVSAATPLYVRRIDAESGAVVVGASPPGAVGLIAERWRWLRAGVDSSRRLTVRVRYRHPGTSAHVTAEAGSPGARVRVLFDHPTTAVAPGQAVVAYHGDEVVGGGWIARALHPEE